MKTPNPFASLALAITLTAASLTGTALADEASFRAALTTLPAKYLGDIPLAKRPTFFRELATDTTTDRLDAKKGWLHWCSDGGDTGGTSMIWAKELPRTGKAPLIFVHMAKPFSGRVAKPAADQTFVLEPVGDEWVDITKTVIPSTVDLTLHFRTRKEDTTIEVAPWKEFARQDGRGNAYDFGERTQDLRWIGNGFVVEKPAAKKLTNN
jgi:hypothetical protein